MSSVEVLGLRCFFSTRAFFFLCDTSESESSDVKPDEPDAEDPDEDPEEGHPAVRAKAQGDQLNHISRSPWRIPWASSSVQCEARRTRKGA